MCACVCVFVSMYMCGRVSVCDRVCVRYVRECVRACVYMCLRVCVCVCVRLCACVCVNECT